VALNSIFVECVLQDFIVLNELVLVLGVPFDLLEVERAWKYCVHDLAMHGPSSALLHFSELQIKELIDPTQNDVLSHEEGLIHNAY
jgi:hypothetical protein